jgi:hypothetical protein
VLISINCNDEKAKWRQFILENKMKWTHARDGDSKFRRLFQINVFPSYVLIDQEGIVRYRGKGAGPQTEGEVSDNVKKALKAVDSSANRPKPESAESRASLAHE